MDVTFLGTGSAMPTGHRYQTGLLVTADGRSMVVDCGAGVLQRLARTEVGYEDVPVVLLTHHHIDHIADLVPLLKARWLAGADPLTVVGPPGTQSLVEDLLTVHDYLAEKVAYDVREVEAGTFSVGGWEVAARETRHSMPCLAYRFGGADGPFCFSGDSEAFPDLISFADGATALAHDCSFPDTVDVSNHPTPTQLGAALTEATATIETVYLTHLYPHTEGHHEEMLASITEVYDGDVQFARDGLTITVE
ncbi:MAG: MBL fold metallo-hydrolase [Halobacteriales archaeon]|nr:MBL fold metallo-hydrolase [Halobacteriales archaeon]